MRADLGQLFSANRAQLQRTALRIVGDRSIAEDLVQEAYLRTRTQAPPHDGLAHPLSFAHRVVRNLALDHHRRCRLESTLFATDDDADALPAPMESAPETVAIQRQALARVAAALDGLPPRSRRVFDLYRLEGRTQRDIAQAMGLSVSTVNQLIHEVLARCRDALRE